MTRLQWILVAAMGLLIAGLVVHRLQSRDQPPPKQQDRGEATPGPLFGVADTPPPAAPAQDPEPAAEPADEDKADEDKADEAPDGAGKKSNEADAPVAVPPDTPAILHGTVRHTNGQAVETWNTVWLLAEGKEAIGIRAREDGTFAAAGLAPGRYEALPLIWSAESTSKMLDLKPGDDVTEAFEFRNLREIPVRYVTTDGKPFIETLRRGKRDSWKWLEYDLAVVVTDSATPPRPAPAMGFANSKFGLGKYSCVSSGRRADGRDGTLYVPEQWPLHAWLMFQSEVIATKTLTSPPESLEFTVREEQLQELLSGVTFILAGDGPRSEIEEGSITLYRNGHRKFEEQPFERDGDRITIRQKVPGRYLFAVWFGEHAEDWLRLIDLPAGKMLDLGTVHLRKAARAPIHVNDESGRPVARAQIRVVNLDHDVALQPTDIPDVTDDDGKLKFRYGPGRYFLALKTPQGVYFGSELEAPLPEGEVHEVVVPASNSVNIYLSGALAEPVRMNVFAGKNRRVASWIHNVPTLWVPKFGEGAYTAEVIEADGTVHRRTFEVRAGRVPTLRFERTTAK